MRIAVDATMIKSEQAGLRSLALGLVRALADVPETQVSVITLAKDTSDWGAADVVRSSLNSGSPLVRTAWREANLDRLVRGADAEVLLVPAPESLRRATVPQVVVVNDLGPLMAPALYGWKRYVQYAATLRGSCRRARHVICISAATKLDLVRWTGIDPAKVTVVHCAPQFAPGSGSPSGATGAGPDGAYVLYVGAALPHKNVATLIEAFRAPVPGMPVRLVLAGPDYAGEAATVMRAASRLSNIEHRGFVSSEDLRALYEGAALLAFPSLYEGFGIPLVEAMAFGVPVVASDIPSLREAGGDAVFYVQDALDPASWQRSFVRALDGDAERLASVTAGGRARALDFSWDAAARQAVTVLESVALASH